MKPIAYIVHAIGYIKSRLSEGSTWVAIGAAAASVSALAPPWSYIGFACGVIAAMVPNRKGCP